jgi:hypothetical protein
MVAIPRGNRNPAGSDIRILFESTLPRAGTTASTTTLPAAMTAPGPMTDLATIAPDSTTAPAMMIEELITASWITAPGSITHTPSSR